MADDVLRRLRAVRARCDADLRRLVRRAAQAGVSTQHIAEAVGISRATLWRRYREDLQQRPSRRRPSG